VSRRASHNDRSYGITEYLRFIASLLIIAALATVLYVVFKRKDWL
jgi:hypothetical protein